MHHLAIMNPRWGLLSKILSGEKTLESRWYKNRSAPWDKIHPGDTIFFKNSGHPVTLKATVKKVEQFADLTSVKVKHLLNKYAHRDGLYPSDSSPEASAKEEALCEGGLGIDPQEISKYYQLFKNKHYCLIIHLKNPQEVEPFHIDKTGFGAMSAWITVDNINQIKISQ